MRIIHHRKKIEKKYIILIILISALIVISLLSLSIRDDRNLTFIERTIKDIGVPIQNILYMPFRFVANKIDTYNEMKRIYIKYKKTDEVNEKTVLIETENKELKKALDDLKELLALNNSMGDYEIVNATVVNRNVGHWYNTITLDKGTSSGIAKNNIVITKRGLIGKIIKVTNYTSEVKLLTTPDLNIKISVGILNGDNITYGLLSGYDIYNNELQIIDIIDDTLIKEGDKVITSGLSDAYPKGIVIGSVSKIEDNEFGISKIVKVKPSSDFKNLNYVSVLKGKK